MSPSDRNRPLVVRVLEEHDVHLVKTDAVKPSQQDGHGLRRTGPPPNAEPRR
jgi:hypothetical protein